MKAENQVSSFILALMILLIGGPLAIGCDFDEDNSQEVSRDEDNSREANFENWRDICMKSWDDNLEHFAAEKMSQLANTFEEWSCVHLCAKYNSGLKTSALKKMDTLAVEFNELVELAEAASFHDDMALKKKAVKKMYPLAKNFNDWNHMATLTRRGYNEDDFSFYQATYRTAIINMINLARSCDDWHDIYQVSRNKDKQLRNIALNKMVQLAKNLKDWLQLYTCAPKDSEFQKLAGKKIIELTKKSKS